MLLVTCRPEEPRAQPACRERTAWRGDARWFRVASRLPNCAVRTSSVDPAYATSPPRAVGNPPFAEEMVRDLAERGVHWKADPVTTYVTASTAESRTCIGAGHDRRAYRSPDLTAKRTLAAAAVIGTQIDIDLLEALVGEIDEARAGRSRTDRPGASRPSASTCSGTRQRAWHTNRS